jgi:hypothetical protein
MEVAGAFSFHGQNACSDKMRAGEEKATVKMSKKWTPA